MNALKYIADKYNLDITQPSPIEIENVGRNILGYWFKDLGFMRGVELGVEKGLFSKILLDANPEMELNCVDSWKFYSEYNARLNTPDLPKRFEETQERLKGYNVKYHKMFSQDAVKRFEDNSLDFIYIDANHDLPWVMNDILWWEKKVRPGGIVCGHDYIRVGTGNTKNFTIEAVNWYTELKPIKTWFLLGTKAKVPGRIRDDARSWLWVKEG
jgi:hypothetical protein